MGVAFINLFNSHSLILFLFYIFPNPPKKKKINPSQVVTSLIKRNLPRVSQGEKWAEFLHLTNMYLMSP